MAGFVKHGESRFGNICIFGYIKQIDLYQLVGTKRVPSTSLLDSHPMWFDGLGVRRPCDVKLS